MVARSLIAAFRRIARTEPLFRPYKFKRKAPPDIRVIYASSLRHAQLKVGKDWVFLYEHWERPSLADASQGVWSRHAAPKNFDE